MTLCARTARIDIYISDLRERGADPARGSDATRGRVAKRAAQIEALEAELASGPSETETLAQRKRRRDERICELQAEIDTLRAEESVTDAEESTDVATEETVEAIAAFTF